MWSLAWEPPLRKRKYMYTNSEIIPYYFNYLNWNLDEYITYKQVSIYLFVGSFTQNMSNLRLAIYLSWEVILSDFGNFLLCCS